MQKHEQKINNILENGFCRLVLDEKTISLATEEILNRAKEIQPKGNKLPFPSIPRVRLYAIAAALLMCCIPLYLFWYHYNDSKITVQTDQVLKHELDRITVLSVTGNQYEKTEIAKKIREKIITNNQSQLLLAAGVRTRALLFERSCIKVDQADSVKTTITLDNGLLSVDIAKGGIDTVSVITRQATFTQLGTFFSVYTDSIHGTVLHVFQGKVRVQDHFGTDLIVEKGRTWNSKNRKNVTESVNLPIESDINRVFKDNKIESLLKWNPDIFVPLKDKKSGKKDHGKQDTSAIKKISEFDLINVLSEQLSRNDFTSAALCIQKLQKSESIDSAHNMLIKVAQRNISVFKYITALKVLGIIIESKPFRVNQREDAWMQCYILHKDYLKSSAEKRLELARDYHKLFPDGNMSDDMASEEIHLQLMLKNYNEAVTVMKQFITKYPHSYNRDYYCYLLASTVREQLQKEKTALDLYKAYIRNYPEGKYKEDAFYWIIKLSLSVNDLVTAGKIRDAYMEKYPKGRWSDEVRYMDIVSSKQN